MPLLHRLEDLVEYGHRADGRRPHREVEAPDLARRNRLHGEPGAARLGSIQDECKNADVRSRELETASLKSGAVHVAVPVFRSSKY